jgi:hypothetical protein
VVLLFLMGLATHKRTWKQPLFSSLALGLVSFELFDLKNNEREWNDTPQTARETRKKKRELEN